MKNKHQILLATVVGFSSNSKGDKFAKVDIGMKFDGIINLNEFTSPVNIGDIFRGIVVSANNDEIIVSKKHVEKKMDFEHLNSLFRKRAKLKAKILEKTDDGYKISLMEKPNTNVYLITKSIVSGEVEVLITNINSTNGVIKATLVVDVANPLQVNDIVHGTVVYCNDFYVFFKLQELANEDYECIVYRNDFESDFREEKAIPLKVLYCRDKRVFLGPVQVKSTGIEEKFEIGQVYDGIVKDNRVNGILVKLSNQSEGFVSLSEISWISNHVSSLKAGDTVRVLIVNIDSEKNRIKLSIKRNGIEENPYTKFFETFKSDEEMEGVVDTTINNTNSNIVLVHLTKYNINAVMYIGQRIKVAHGDKIKVRVSGINKSIPKVSVELSGTPQVNLESRIEECEVLVSKPSGLEVKVLSNGANVFISAREISSDLNGYMLYKPGDRIKAKATQKKFFNGKTVLQLSIREITRENDKKSIFEAKKQSGKTSDISLGSFFEFI